MLRDPRRRVALLPIYPTLATLPVWLDIYKRTIEPVVDHAYAVVCHNVPEYTSRAIQLLEPHFDIVTAHPRQWPHGEVINEMLAQCNVGDDILLLEDDVFLSCPPKTISDYFDALDQYDYVGANVAFTSEPAHSISMARYQDAQSDPAFDSWGGGCWPAMFWSKYETLAQTTFNCNAVLKYAPESMPEIGLLELPPEGIGLDTMQHVMWQLRHAGKRQLRTNSYRLCTYPGNDADVTKPEFSVTGWPWIHVGCISYMSLSILGAPGSEASLCNSNQFEVPMAMIAACMDLWKGREEWYDAMVPDVMVRVDKQRQWADWALYERLRSQFTGYLSGEAGLRVV